MERIEKKDQTRSPAPVWLALLVVSLAALVCASLTTLGAQRLDVFHAALFDSCTNHAYQFHWQAPQRYAHDLRNDFIVSTQSFVLVEIWFADGLTLRFSRILPHTCLAVTSSQLRSSIAVLQREPKGACRL